MTVGEVAGKPQTSTLPTDGDHDAAVSSLLDCIESRPIFSSVQAVGHRLVQGMKHSELERVTPKLLTELHRITAYDPDHLPREIEAVQRRNPKLPQVACFDAASHRAMPPVAKLLPIPHRYAAEGAERYGFHGLSYEFLLEELGRLEPVAVKGRVILARLGSGASMAAVHYDKSVDTSMTLTPTSGLVMGTRTGDLDPGLVCYLARTEHMTAPKFSGW